VRALTDERGQTMAATATNGTTHPAAHWVGLCDGASFGGTDARADRSTLRRSRAEGAARERLAVRGQRGAKPIDMSTKGPTGTTWSEVTPDAYRLISIDHTNAPDGSGTDNWLVYRIAQGTRVITGYRQGPVGVVTADVRNIVDALNARCMVSEKPGTPFTRLPAPRPATPAVPLRHKDFL